MSGTLAYVSLTGAILLGIAGQVLLKSGSVGAPNVVAQLFNPLTIVGFAVYALAAIAYVAALNKIPVSIAFPSVGASYAILAVLAHILWNEPLGWPQIGGILLIGGGIFMVHQ